MEEPSTPLTYATAIARYIRDPSTIRARTMDEFGRAPSLDRCRHIRRGIEERQRNTMKALQHSGHTAPVPTVADEQAYEAGEKMRRLAADALRRAVEQAIATPEAIENKAAAFTAPRAPAFERVIHLAAHLFNITPEDITGKGRMQHLAHARHAIVHVLHTKQHWSFPRIGKLLGGRDHSTAINSRDRAAGLLKNDQAFAAVVEALEQEWAR